MKRCSVSPFRNSQTADLAVVLKVSEKGKDSLQSIGEVLDKLYHLSGSYTLELIVGDALIVSAYNSGRVCLLTARPTGSADICSEIIALKS